jgi:hypothetical protein
MSAQFYSLSVCSELNDDSSHAEVKLEVIRARCNECNTGVSQVPEVSQGFTTHAHGVAKRIKS